MDCYECSIDAVYKQSDRGWCYLPFGEGMIQTLLGYLTFQLGICRVTKLHIFPKHMYSQTSYIAYLLLQGMINADANVRDQCIWCLGNIAGDSTQYRDMLITYPGVLQALLMNIQHPATDVLLRNATWSLSNFCRGKSSMDLRAAKCIISALTWLVGLDDIQIVADACWGFSYLTSGDKEIMQMVVDTKIAKRCVELIGTSDSRVVTPALRVIGNIVTGNTEQTQSALDAGCLEALVPLIMKGKRGIRKQAIWIVSNIAAGSKEQINSIFATPHLMELIFSHVLDSDWFIRKEAMWVLTNITMTRHPSHLETLVQYGVLNTLVQFLSCSDARMICTVLDAISVYLSYSSLLVKNPHENGSNQYGVLLEEAGLVDILEELLSSDFTDVFYKAENLLEKYFQNSDMSPSMNLSTTNTAGIAVYGNLSESNAHTMHPSNLELQFGSMPLQEAPFIDDNIHAASRMQVPTGPDADYSHAYNMEGVTIASYPHTVTNFTTDGPIESFPFGMDHFAPSSSGPSIPPAIRPQSLAHSDNNSTLAPNLVPSTSTNAQSTRTVPSKLSTFRQPFGVREAQNTVSNMHHPVLSDVSGVKSVRIASMGSKNDQATGSFQYGVL